MYVGKSAGAIVAGSSIATATWKGWDDPSVVQRMERYEDWMGCRGFCFAGGVGGEEGDGDVSFFPHMSEDWNDLVKEKKMGVSGTVCCMREEDACCVIGEKRTAFVASGPTPMQ